ncbi:MULTISPECIES: hypothetical protein [Streptomyces]|uniref:Uncharacterized protein n=1 Tax=Streptomyces luteosporeus TaxID=173856 RepID=A0ABN3TTT0_9ACTN
MQRYETQVILRTATGEQVTYRGEAISSVPVPADQPLDSATATSLADNAAAAALAQEPGGEVICVRIHYG